MQRLMSNLPEDLIFSEILYRIPLKFLVRFTIICRRWHYLIKSIEFQIAQASYHHHNSPSFLVDGWWKKFNGEVDVIDVYFSIINEDHNNQLIDRINASIEDTCNHIYSFYPRSNYVSDYASIRVPGSVHGLLCLCLQPPATSPYSGVLFLYILNPLTNMLKTVPKPPIETLLLSESRFCYDRIDRDFKIINIKYHRTLQVWVYSCNLDTWTEVKDDSLPNSDFLIVANLNDRIYVEFKSKPKILVVFDVHSHVFKRMPCPTNSIQRAGPFPFRYIKWKDSLGVIISKVPNDPEASRHVIYTLDETRSAWIQHYITDKNLESYFLRLGLENGDIVVEGQGRQNLELFKVQSSQLKKLTTLLFRCFDVMLYTESLVCLNGMHSF